MKKFLVALSAGCLVALLTASSALAVHARPKSATPLTIKLVPAFDECTTPTPGMFHGLPLNLPSCSPPTETSSYLTARDPTRAIPFNGAADGFATIILKVTCLNPSTTQQVTGSNPLPPCNDPGDQIDVKITAISGGVRCTLGAPTQGSCAGGAGTLYNGKVLGSSNIRISDHYNQIIPNPTGADCSDTTSCPATVEDLPFDVGTQCTAGACNTVTSADLTVPAVTLEGNRSVVGLSQVTIADAGLDGGLAGGPACPPTCAQDDPANTAATQGLFIP